MPAIPLADAVESTAKAAADNHKRFCKTSRKGPAIPPGWALLPVPDQAGPKRPHPRDLTNHPSKAVARAAQKVLDAVAKLDEAWAADAAKAELRAERDQLKKQLAKVGAQLRGTTQAPPAIDARKVREWAIENGHHIATAGKPPQHIVDLYLAAR